MTYVAARRLYHNTRCVITIPSHSEACAKRPGQRPTLREARRSRPSRSAASAERPSRASPPAAPSPRTEPAARAASRARGVWGIRSRDQSGGDVAVRALAGVIANTTKKAKCSACSSPGITRMHPDSRAECARARVPDCARQSQGSTQYFARLGRGSCSARLPLSDDA